MRFIRVSTIVLLLTGLAAQTLADESDDIEFVFNAVESSECVFIRNGKEYAAGDAEQHLRIK